MSLAGRSPIECEKIHIFCELKIREIVAEIEKETLKTHGVVSSEITKLCASIVDFYEGFRQTARKQEGTADFAKELDTLRRVMMNGTGQPEWEFCHKRRQYSTTGMDDQTIDLFLSGVEEMFTIFLHICAIHTFGDTDRSRIDRARERVRVESNEVFLEKTRAFLIAFHLPRSAKTEEWDTGRLREFEWEAACRLQKMCSSFQQAAPRTPDLGSLRARHITAMRDMCRVWRWVSFRLNVLFPSIEAAGQKIRQTMAHVFQTPRYLYFFTNTENEMLQRIDKTIRERVTAFVTSFRVNNPFRERLIDFLWPFFCGADGLIAAIREGNTRAFKQDNARIGKFHITRLAPRPTQSDETRIAMMDDIKKIGETFDMKTWFGNPVLDTTGLCTVFAFCYVVELTASIKFFNYCKALSGKENKEVARLFCGPWQFPQCMKTITQAEYEFKAQRSMPLPRLVCFAGDAFVVAHGQILKAKPLREDPLDVCYQWCKAFHVFNNDINEDETNNMTFRSEIWNDKSK